MNIPKIFKIEINHLTEHIEDIINRTLLFKIINNVYNSEELNELDYLKNILGISKNKLCTFMTQKIFDHSLKNTTLKNSSFAKFDYILIFDNYQKIIYIINEILKTVPFKVNQFTPKESYQINQNSFEYSEQSSGQRKALDYEKYNLDIKFYLNEIYNELSKIVFIIYDKEKLKQLLIKYYEILKTKSINVKSTTQSDDLNKVPSYFEYVTHGKYNHKNINATINAINNLKNIIEELE